METQLILPASISMDRNAVRGTWSQWSVLQHHRGRRTKRFQKHGQKHKRVFQHGAIKRSGCHVGGIYPYESCSVVIKMIFFLFINEYSHELLSNLQQICGYILSMNIFLPSKQGLLN